MSKKISYVQQSEPNFIKKFKEKISYKEGPTVDTKHQHYQEDEDDKNDREKDDEAPVIVVLKDGDLSAEQVAALNAEQADDDLPADGKIIFKKPTKKRTSEGEEAAKCERKKKKVDKNAAKNTQLLSFADEDEENS